MPLPPRTPTAPRPADVGTPASVLAQVRAETRALLDDPSPPLLGTAPLDRAYGTLRGEGLLQVEDYLGWQQLHQRLGRDHRADAVGDQLVVDVASEVGRLSRQGEVGSAARLLARCLDELPLSQVTATRLLETSRTFLPQLDADGRGLVLPGVERVAESAGQRGWTRTLVEALGIRNDRQLRDAATDALREELEESGRHDLDALAELADFAWYECLRTHYVFRRYDRAQPLLDRLTPAFRHQQAVASAEFYTCQELGDTLSARRTLDEMRMTTDDVAQRLLVQLMWSSVHYGDGDYAAYWGCVRSIADLDTASVERLGDPALLRVLLRCRLRLAPDAAAGLEICDRLLALCAEPSDPEAAVECLSDLMWAADRWGTPDLRSRAAALAGQSISRATRALEADPGSAGCALDLAYVGAVGRVDAVLDRGLDALPPSPDEQVSLRAMRASVLVRDAPDAAAGRFQALRAARPADVDLWGVGLVRALLDAGELRQAHSEATDLVRQLPGHVQLLALLAETTLRLAEQTDAAVQDPATGPEGGGGSDAAARAPWRGSAPARKTTRAATLGYAEAAQLVDEVLTGQRHLEQVMLDGQRPPSSVHGDLLPGATREALAERGLYAIVKAREGAPSLTLRDPLALRSEKRRLLAELRPHNRLRWRVMQGVLRRQRLRLGWRRLLLTLSTVGAGLALVAAVWPELVRAEPDGELRLALFGLAIALAALPYVQRISLAGVDLERSGGGPYQSDLRPPLDLHRHWAAIAVPRPVSGVGTPEEQPAPEPEVDADVEADESTAAAGGAEMGHRDAPQQARQQARKVVKRQGGS